MSDTRPAGQQEQVEAAASKHAGRELIDKLSAVQKRRNEKKSGKLIIESLVAGLEARIKLEAVSPTLKGFSETVNTVREAVWEAAERVEKAIDELVKIGDSTPLEVQKKAIAEYRAADAALKSMRTDSKIDLSAGDAIDKKAIEGWQKSKGGRDLKDFARNNELDIIEIKYKGVGNKGEDVVELVIDNGKAGTGKVRSRNATPAEVEAKRAALKEGVDQTAAV